MARDARIYSTRTVTYNRNNDPAVRFESIGSIEIIDRFRRIKKSYVRTIHPLMRFVHDSNLESSIGGINDR